jgi:hypothetical protein
VTEAKSGMQRDTGLSLEKAAKMLEGAGEKNPKLREQIETLAGLQYQRGREAADRSEHWEIVERMEKVNEDSERQVADMQKILDEFLQMDKAAERRMEEMRAMEEGRLRRMPPGERRAGEGPPCALKTGNTSRSWACARKTRPPRAGYARSRVTITPYRLAPPRRSGSGAAEARLGARTGPYAGSWMRTSGNACYRTFGE